MQFNVKALLALILVGITAAMLFVPVVPGAGDIRAMFVLLTGLAVRDYFGSESSAKALEAQKQAYDPAPPQSHVAQD